MVEDEQSKPPQKGLPEDYPLILEEKEYDEYKSNRRKKAKRAKPLFEKVRSTQIEEEEDVEKPKAGKGLKRSLPVLLGPDDNLTIDDIENMVADAPWEKDAKSPVKRDLEELEEIVQEFTNVRYPDFKEREALKKRDIFKDVNPLPGRREVNETLQLVMEDHIAKIGDMDKLTEADIPRLREQWVRSCQDIMKGVPERLPPFRGVNHHITLIDDNKRYNYHLPRCPDSLKTQLPEKIDRYTRYGWWEAVQTDQAAPMLCIPKKTGKLRTAIDARKRNANSVKDVTPFPDQDQIRLDVARALIRSKIDFSDAYEQVRTAPEDVHKSAFATIYGTFISHTM